MIKKLEVANVSHAFDDSRVVFENLSSSLPTEEIVFLDGVDGSGRSTLIHMMAALVIPKQGTILINDLALSEITFEEFLKTRLKIGYSFEFAGLLNNRTIRENLLLPILYHNLLSIEEASRAVNELCERFKLSEVAHLRPSAVPGSHRKACVVARAFVLNPEMVLLDEPFAGLSATTSNALRELIGERRAAGSLKHVFVSCQNSRDVEGWATQHLYVEKSNFRSIEISNKPSLKGAA